MRKEIPNQPSTARATAADKSLLPQHGCDAAPARQQGTTHLRRVMNTLTSEHMSTSAVRTAAIPAPSREPNTLAVKSVPNAARSQRCPGVRRGLDSGRHDVPLLDARSGGQPQELNSLIVWIGTLTKALFCCSTRYSLKPYSEFCEIVEL